MNLCGIIAEYNPFHNGHRYHIDEAKKITNADLMIAIISGNFTQRGEVSIIDKFEKTKAALDNGIDIVIELPAYYTLQNASVFGQKSIEILKLLKINHIVFGSETNDLNKLQEIADSQINVDYLKEIMKDGISYPKAYSLLQGSLYPNDILAIAYLKALKDSQIQAHSILRTNDYHGDKLETIASAKAIRNAIKNHDDNYQIACPLTIDDPHFADELYPYLRTLLLTSDIKELQKYHLVNEGIEKLLKDNAFKYDNYEDFINHSVSKRYTKARIMRTLTQIMMQTLKSEVSQIDDQPYARILGFNQKGQAYLHEIKKDEDTKLISQFKHIPLNMRSIEWKSDLLYASLLKKDKRDAFLKQELKGPIIIK